MKRLPWLLAAFVLLAATPAAADPVSIFLAIDTAIASAGAALGLSVTAAFAVSSFVITAAATTGLRALAGALAPKPRAATNAIQDRQASVINVTLGEAPREWAMGWVSSGGQLLDIFTYGGTYQNDWTVQVIKIADHAIDGLEGFWVDDVFVTYAGNGSVTAYGGQMFIYLTQASLGGISVPTELQTLSPACAPGSCKGVTTVTMGVKLDAANQATPLVPSVPRFQFQFRGAKLYDPRKDSTVPGGSGAHRWTDPTTWEYSQNAAICRYNFQLGLYAGDDVSNPSALWVGRGLSRTLSPPTAIFSAANVCDEDVDDGLGGTEKRYVMGGIIRANDGFDVTETRFAACMAGEVVQVQGGIGVDPGAAKSPVFDITDDDLVVGLPVTWSRFVSRKDRVNTVVPRYVEPAQRWTVVTGPIARDDADVINDRGSRELSLDLDFVNRRGQAQRIAEIRRRQHRFQQSGTLALGPRFIGLEAGDWGTYTSARRTDGVTTTVVIAQGGRDQRWNKTLALKETHASVYGSTADFPSIPASPSIPPPDALALSGVDASIINIDSGAGLIPAVRFIWDTPVELGITRIRAAIRALGGTETAVTITEDVNAGALIVTNGLGSARSVEVRLEPLGAPYRPIIASTWKTLVVSAVEADPTPSLLSTIATIESEAIAAQAAADAAQADATAALSDATSAIADVIDLASYGGDTLNTNPAFAAWPVGNPDPDDWIAWNSATLGRVGGHSSRIAVEIAPGGSVEWGIQHATFAAPVGDYEIQADIRLISGTLSGAGVLVQTLDSGGLGNGGDVHLVFNTDPDVSGAVLGAGAGGTTYRFRKTVSVTVAGTVAFNLYAMANWNGFGQPITSARDIIFDRVAVVAANPTAKAAMAAVSSEAVTRASGDSSLGALITSVRADFGANRDGALNPNPAFAAWSGALPDNWTNWATSTVTKVTGQSSANALQIAAGAGADGGLVLAPFAAQKGAYELQVDVRLVSGALTGAGVLSQLLDAAFAYDSDAVNIQFAIDPDVTGAVVGAGTPGQTYRFRKAFTVTSAAAKWFNLYAMAHWSANGSIAAANSIIFDRIAIGTADAVALAASAAVTAEAIARASGDSSLATSITTVSATMGAGPRPNLIRGSDFTLSPVADDIQKSLTGGTPWAIYRGYAFVPDFFYVTGAGSGSQNAYVGFNIAKAVTPGEVYTASANFQLVANGGGGLTSGQYYIQVNWFTDQTFSSLVTSSTGTGHSVGSGGVLFEQSGTTTRRLAQAEQFTVPAGAGAARVYFIFNGLNGSNIQAAFAEPKFEPGALPATAYNLYGSTVNTSAEVTTQATALATIDGKLAARLSFTAAAGPNPAKAELIDDGTNSLIQLVASILSLAVSTGGTPRQVMLISSGDVHLFEPLVIDIGSYRLALGPGIGASGDMFIWAGSSSLGLTSMTPTNGVFSLGTNGVFYLGHILGRSISGFISGIGAAFSSDTSNYAVGSYTFVAPDVPPLGAWKVKGQIYMSNSDPSANTVHAILYCYDTSTGANGVVIASADSLDSSSSGYIDIEVTGNDSYGGPSRSLQWLFINTASPSDTARFQVTQTFTLDWVSQ